jgi:hypothetical protein
MIVAKYYREAALGQCLGFLLSVDLGSRRYWGFTIPVARGLVGTPHRPVRLRSSRKPENAV